MKDIISRLKLESGEFDAKIKRAGQELLNYAEHCRKMGLEMGYANRDAKDFAKQLGSMATVSQTARGKVNELSEAFVNAKVMYKNMTDEEKKNEFGRNLSASIDQLKTRLNAAKKDLADVQSELNGSKFGQFGNVIDTIGHKLGLTTNATELLTSKTALMYSGIGAGIAIIGKATQEWTAYNAELAKQDQITTVTTGLKDDDVKRMTDTMRALSDTYNVDFRDAINAANTLMSQFGVSGDEATQLIKDGMKGMIHGDGPKLLSMIQQYAPAFQSAGVSASQLVAVIHNSEGGIFTDQNMNAIVMGIKNIRLMTKSTSEALAKLGLDGQDMAKKMSNGSMTVFDALKIVASQLKNVDSNSQAAGEVMQQVFGRQGVMAGTNLAKAIEGLNTDLGQTKKQLGDVGDAYDELQTANEKLNTAIREAFSYDGWEQMATGIKSKLVTALATVIEQLGKIRQWFSDFTPEGQTENIQTTEQKDMIRRLAYVRSGSNKQYWHQQNKEYYDQQVSERKYKVLSLRGDDSITRGLRQKAEADLKAWQNLRDEYNKKANDILTAPPKSNTINNVKPTPIDNGGNGGKVNKAEVEAATGSIDAQTKKVQDLQKAWRAAADDKSREDIKKQIEQAQLVLDAMNGKTKMSKITITADTKEALEAVKKIDGVKIDPKSFTVTAEDDKSAEELRKIGAVQIADKTFSVIPDIGDTLEKVKAIDGVKIDPKSFIITAETTEALAKIQEINGIKIQPKKLEVQVPKMADIAPNGLTGKARTPEDLQQGAVKMKQAVKLEIDQDASKVDTETLKTLMKDAIQNGINGMDLQFGILGDKIGKGIDIPDDSWHGILDQYNALREQIGLEPIVINFETGKIGTVVREVDKLKKTINTTADVVGTIGQAFNAIEDPAAKVAGVVAQAIANIALAYSDALAKDETSKFNIWGFIAAAAASTISMASTIAAIHSQTGYAEGGIVKGNSYSGDNLMAQGPNGQLIGLNAGEIVLNRAQQGVIAGALQGGGQTVRVVGKLSGESIFICAENWAKRTGKGEFVTWR